jgi:hypothetical protein
MGSLEFFNIQISSPPNVNTIIIIGMYVRSLRLAFPWVVPFALVAMSFPR